MQSGLAPLHAPKRTRGAMPRLLGGINMLKQLFLVLAILVSGSTLVAGQQPVRLRVLSYNIHHAQGVDGKLDLQRIANVILSVKPDFVALQEVDQNTSRTGGVDQAAELAKLTEMKSVFGANIDLQGGHYGNAVLTRLPIGSHQNVLLPNGKHGEQRGVIQADLKLPGSGQSLLLLATHFDHRKDSSERLQSARKVNALVAERPDQPALLAGDLNATPDSQTLQALQQQWTLANEQPLATIPVKEPVKQIDFILLRPAERWSVVEVKVLDEAVASDHRAILAVLELK